MNTTMFFNGLRADGSYITEPMKPGELCQVITGHRPDAEEKAHTRELKARTNKDSHLGVVEGIDPARLDQAGWGVLFAAAKKGSNRAKEQDAIREALSPLLHHRRAQAGEFYREYFGPAGLRADESKPAWLARHGAGPGPANPEKVPFYLLLVGDPEEIPYRVQFQLNVQYGVGRIHFDTLEEYDNYARSVVAAETGGLTLPRKAAFFGVACDDDQSTQASSRDLVAPLADIVEKDQAGNGWQVERWLKEQAYKKDLSQLLGGDQTPAFLFTASHGMGFDIDDPRILSHQGALICQDWPGPRNGRKAIGDDLYFSGDDLNSDANLLGMMAFFFACYGAGTPRYDEFSKQAFRQREAIAPRAFVASLPSKMLGRPRGGALCAVGHVERAWSSSFVGPRAKDGSRRQLECFQSVLKRLLEGATIGWAMEHMYYRYAEISSDLASTLEDIEYGEEYDDVELAMMWTTNNDARDHSIVGDPATRMAVDGEGVGRDAVDPSAVAVPDLAPSPAIDEPSAEVETVERETEAAETSADAGYDFAAATEDEAASPCSTERPFSSDNATGDSLARPGELNAALARWVRGAESLVVRTYVADKPIAAADDVSLADRGELFAETRIGVEGEVETLVVRPTEPAAHELLEHHAETLTAASNHRREMIEGLLSAIQERD